MWSRARMLEAARSKIILARDRTVAWRTRFRDAVRTIGEAKRCRLGFELQPAIPFSEDEPSAGYLDLIAVKDGSMRVAGWSRHANLQIRTERQSRSTEVLLERVDVPAEYGAKGFDVLLVGSDAVSIDVDGEPVIELDLREHHQHGNAWLQTLLRVVSVPVVHGVSLFKFAAFGDVAAGRILETYLVPLKVEPSTIVATAGIFRTSDTDAADTPPVDIILPVYNAFDDVTECLARLERHTDTANRVIIINDASTDERIAPLLAEFADRRENTELITAPQNRGFIHSVNAGFATATRDVVLLNSDAFVPANWLPRLMAPFLSDPTVASVTPMTNNGEIASIPMICKVTDLSAGAVDHLDRVAQSLDPVTAVTKVPTGVGFCMAISRKWLDQVPEFDTVFGAGYGEEVDWCQKVIARGGQHLLTGALFVEHRGGSSFGPEKLARVLDNNRRISKRYPSYDADVQSFIRSDPAIGSRLVLALAHAGLDGPVPVYFGHRMGGGAEFWLLEQIESRTSEGKPAVAIRDGDEPDTALLEVYLEEDIVKGNVPLDELAQYLSALPEKNLVYSNLVGARDPVALIETVVASLTDADTFRVAFHDYFPICPSHNLLGWDGTYCDLPDDDACAACYARLAEKLERSPESIASWRQHWAEWLERADDVLVFSNSSERIVSKAYPHVANRIIVKPHEVLNPPQRIEPPKSGAPVIGVLGGIGYPKGAAVLQELAELGESDLKIVIIGKIDPTYDHPNIHVHGSYERHEVGTLAKRYKIDRWFIPSIWPETFSYTTHECLATGLPVMVFDLGAPADVVRQHQNGSVLPVGLETLQLFETLNAASSA